MTQTMLSKLHSSRYRIIEQNKMVKGQLSLDKCKQRSRYQSQYDHAKTYPPMLLHTIHKPWHRIGLTHPDSLNRVKQRASRSTFIYQGRVNDWEKKSLSIYCS